MRSFLPFLFLSVALFLQVFSHANSQNQLAKGRQPQISVDTQGVMRIVFGTNDSIMVMNSSDQGKTFSKPELIAQLKGIHLGMSRGPQIASSANYTLVTAMSNDGNIHTFQLNHETNQWKKIANVNDVPASAPEGLMSIAADDQDNFFAVWLDIRSDKSNKIYVAKRKAGEQWSKNMMAYQSPDGTVCECCKPNIAVGDSKVYVMFRNWLDGSRDMYVMQSEADQLSFAPPKKLGEGTWLLKGCPMDGGGVLIDDQNEVHTSWQREGKIFYAKPGKKEMQIGEGRASSISGQKNPVVAWQDGGTLKIKYLDSGKEIQLGEGAFIEVVTLKDKSIFSVWENDGKVYSKRI